ncbi:MAG: methylmalonyl Co-A mutase-associated GTPase MeaB [Myxococcota bacterium]
MAPPKASKPRGGQPTIDDLVDGVRAGDRAMLGRAITLVESDHPDHQERAQDMLTRLLPYTGEAQRVGISGVPGVGKSTFIDALGVMLIDRGKKVAVVAVDPSSAVSGGSILGDKTRMARLAKDPNAFIRPSPSGGTLGGVARKTRESMLVCEAAGFDVVLVETVGVGQSEVVVSDMVDFFLVLMLAGAGDDLQGIKRGIMEVADMLAINKADGPNARPAQRARKDYEMALHLLRGGGGEEEWHPPVVTCSSTEGTGLEELWAQVEAHRQTLSASGALEAMRHRQKVKWMWRIVEDRLWSRLRAHPDVKAQLPSLEDDVRDGRLTPTVAAQRILDAFGVGRGQAPPASTSGPEDG